jgi:hypothetical protein
VWRVFAVAPGEAHTAPRRAHEAGAAFVNGKLAERPEESTISNAARRDLGLTKIDPQILTIALLGECFIQSAEVDPRRRRKRDVTVSPPGHSGYVAKEPLAGTRPPHRNVVLAVGVVVPRHRLVGGTAPLDGRQPPHPPRAG